MRGGIVTVLLRGRRLPLLPCAPLRAKLVAHPPPRCECPPQRPSPPAQHCSPRPRVQRNRARDARPRDDECVTAPRAKHMAEAARLEECEHLRGGRSSRLCACARYAAARIMLDLDHIGSGATFSRMRTAYASVGTFGRASATPLAEWAWASAASSCGAVVSPGGCSCLIILDDNKRGCNRRPATENMQQATDESALRA